LLKRSGDAGGEAAHYFVAIFQLPRMDVLVDAYGRKWVAQVLSAVAKRLERQGSWVKAVAVRSAGGQVLAFFAETNQEKLNEFIQKFLRENEFVDIGELKAKVSFQVGVAPIMDSEKIQHAMDDADLAAHETYNVQFFDDSLREQKQLQYRIESLMDKALAAGEFAVWYQPKYDIRTQKCVGAEALVRWNSPEMGFLMPGKFIGLFEQNGFVTKLDFYILETVFKFQKAQLDADAPIVTVSVNQSRLHMREQGYLEKIKALADKYGETSLVELELTETAFDVGVREREQAMTVVRSLKAMGFALSMDDFGSGYSDISLLNILPMDVMKLDRSLLTASENSKRMQIVLSQVIQLGRKLGMDVICEGIETKEQEELLIECGCYKGQGFLYAKPMPEEDFRAFLAERA